MAKEFKAECAAQNIELKDLRAKAKTREDEVKALYAEVTKTKEMYQEELAKVVGANGLGVLDRLAEEHKKAIRQLEAQGKELKANVAQEIAASAATHRQRADDAVASAAEAVRKAESEKVRFDV